MTDMVERIARAIEQAMPNYISDELPQHDFLASARAALEAMREPTPAMFDAAESWGDDAERDLRFWQAMIDAALTPPRSP